MGKKGFNRFNGLKRCAGLSRFAGLIELIEPIEPIEPIELIKPLQPLKPLQPPFSSQNFFSFLNMKRISPFYNRFSAWFYKNSQPNLKYPLTKSPAIRQDLSAYRQFYRKI